MFKHVALASLIAMSTVAAAPASAQMSGDMKMECSEAGMKKAKMDMMKMSDGAKKDMAMKHMDMAQDAMMKKDMAACEMHMKEAMKPM